MENKEKAKSTREEAKVRKYREFRSLQTLRTENRCLSNSIHYCKLTPLTLKESHTLHCHVTVDQTCANNGQTNNLVYGYDCGVNQAKLIYLKMPKPQAKAVLQVSRGKNTT